MNQKEIVLFETEDNEIKLEVPVNEETVWLNRQQMAELFDVSADYLLGQSDVKKKEKPVVKDDRLNRKLELLNDENLQRMEDYVDLLLKTQGE